MSLLIALQGGGGPATITADLAANEAQDVAAFSATLVHTAALFVTEGQDVAAFSGTLVHVANLAASEAQDLAAFDATLIPVAGAAVGGGGYGLRPIRIRKARRISEREQTIEEIIYVVARQQIEQPRVAESIRAEQLAAAMAARGVEADARHAEALAAERDRLISLEVAQFLRNIQAEDEALLMILAETV